MSERHWNRYTTQKFIFQIAFQYTFRHIERMSGCCYCCCLCVVITSNYLLTFACCTNDVFPSSFGNTKHRNQTTKNWQIAYRIHCSKTESMYKYMQYCKWVSIQIHGSFVCFNVMYCHISRFEPLKLTLNKLWVNLFFVYLWQNKS